MKRKVRQRRERSGTAPRSAITFHQQISAGFGNHGDDDDVQKLPPKIYILRIPGKPPTNAPWRVKKKKKKFKVLKCAKTSRSRWFQRSSGETCSWKERAAG